MGLTGQLLWELAKANLMDRRRASLCLLSCQVFGSQQQELEMRSGIWWMEDGRW